MGRSSAVTPDQFATFGELLKYLRRRAGLTQRELSIAVGYSTAQISRLEQNQRVPDQVTLAARFVAALHIEKEPEVVARLLELAKEARQVEAPSPTLADVLVSRNNLPAQLTSFIGREKETADIIQLLRSSRLVTLTGAGGSGKTRLALQVAANLVTKYADGVWLVELASTSDPGRVAAVVAKALDVYEQPGQPMIQRLTEHLRARRLLLVLDNCEHLIQACAELAETLLRAVPGLGILATSREALGISGESSYIVPPLSLPALRPAVETLLQSEAVRLFVDRAAAVKLGFHVTDANAPAVAQVCLRLDGIPLAIELAAARVKALTAEQIAERLDDRFQLLAGGSRTAMPRHRTLRALIDWSYDLLPEAERVLLQRLSVFWAGWTLGAAEAVCAGNLESSTASTLASYEIRDLLAALVDKSLVAVADHGGEAWYSMLETIRQYGRDKLLQTGEVEWIRDRHLQFYLGLAEEAEPELHTPEGATWIKRLEMEHHNLRAALDWSFTRARPPAWSLEAGLRLAGAIFWFWHWYGHLSEMREWAERGLAVAESGVFDNAPAKAKIIHGVANTAMMLGDTERADTTMRDSLALYRQIGDELGAAKVMFSMADIATYQGDFGRAAALFAESLALGRAQGDLGRWTTSATLYMWGVAACQQSDYKGATRMLQESLDLSRQLGDKRGIAFALRGLGTVAQALGNYTRAETLLNESLALARESGIKQGVAWALSELGRLALGQGNYPQAARLLEESLEVARELGIRWHLAHAIQGLAMAAGRQGEYAQAVALLEESLGLFREAGDRLAAPHIKNSLGDVARAQGDYERAAGWYEEALGTFGALKGDKLGLDESFRRMAALASAQGQSERAARLLGASEATREAIGALLLPADRPEYDRDVAAVRAELSDEVFKAAWAEGRAMTLEQAVAQALGPPR